VPISCPCRLLLYGTAEEKGDSIVTDSSIQRYKYTPMVINFYFPLIAKYLTPFVPFSTTIKNRIILVRIVGLSHINLCRPVDACELSFLLSKMKYYNCRQIENGQKCQTWLNPSKNLNLGREFGNIDPKFSIFLK
jgi:hypothetical protein